MPFITIRSLLILFLLHGVLTGRTQDQKGFEFIEHVPQKQIDLTYNGKQLTAYCYYDSVFKPVLFPVKTLDGITVTRGFPLQPVPGERTDHPHHIGLWLNYESVNGIDFWNSSTAIPPGKRPHYGFIRHEKVIEKKAKGQTAQLTVTAQWQDIKGKTLLHEKTTYRFEVKDQLFFIERETTLSALNETVVFKDAKDGFFAIRVARELEMPSNEPSGFVGQENTSAAIADSTVTTGRYYNSEGISGDSVWSSQARWAVLKGKKDGAPITIGLFDHPQNTGYPTYWHARGYGLFALNPLGRDIFSKGREHLQFTLQPHQSARFRYKVVIAAQDLSAERLNKIADDFAAAK